MAPDRYEERIAYPAGFIAAQIVKIARRAKLHI